MHVSTEAQARIAYNAMIKVLWQTRSVENALNVARHGSTRHQQRTRP